MGRPATLKIDILADAKGVAKGVGEAEGALGKLGRGAGAVGKTVALGLAAGGVAVGAFAVASIRSASSVEQAFGAVESVFGKAAGEVKKYAEGAATNLGLAKSEYASLAAVVGSQLQSMGKSQREAAKESDRLIGIGADLAATFGGSVSDAVGAVGSLLRGERDPIERYGIAIKDADIKARLAADGQDKLTGAALKTATAQATLTLLTEQSKNAAGAFGRESNTLAGQQERLRAQFENVKATVGAGLTPVLTSLLTFVNGSLLPGAQRLGAELAERLKPAFQAVSTFVTGTVLPAFRSLSGGSTETQGRLGGFAGFITGTVVPTAAKLAAYFTGTLVPAFRTVASFVTANVVPVLAALAGFVVGTLIPAVVRLATPVIGALRSALASVGKSIDDNRSNLSALGNAVLTVAKVIGPLASVVGTVLAAAFRVAGAVISGVIGILSDVIGAARAAADAIRAVASAASKVGGVVGKLNPFAADELGFRPSLLTGGPSLATPSSGLATAALGEFREGTFRSIARTAGRATVVDARTIDASVRLEALYVDDRVVDRLERAMRDQAVRLGRTPALGAR